MSLTVAPFARVSNATSAVGTKSKVVIGLPSGSVNVYSLNDGALERKFTVGRGRVTRICAFPGLDIVAVIADSRCTVHDLTSRREILNVDSRSAQFVSVLESTQRRNVSLVVASRYKLRIFDFDHDMKVRASYLLATPDKQVINALWTADGEVFVGSGSRAKLWRANIEGCHFVPVALFHPGLGLSHITATASSGDAVLAVGSSGAQILGVTGAHDNTSPRSIAILDKTRITGASVAISEPTNIPLFAVSMPHALQVLNPSTGTSLAELKLSSGEHGIWRLIGGNLVSNDAQVALLHTELSVEDVEKLETREAATLAFKLSHGLHENDPRIREVEQRYATDLFESGDLESAMRLFTRIEEYDDEDGRNRRIVTEMVQPLLEKFATLDTSGAASVQSSRQSVLSGSTTSTSRRRSHPLDPLIVYLVHTRRKLRLTGADMDVGVDTLLFESYMLVKSPLVGPLLRSPNKCDPVVVRRELLEAGKWRELVGFLKRMGTHASHQEALQLLEDHREPPEGLASYLEHARDWGLIVEFAKPVLESHPELVKRLFYEENAYDSATVFEFLAGLKQPEEALHYAAFRIAHGDSTPELHEAHASQLADESALLDFLATEPAHYRAAVLLDDVKLPSRARALLLSRIGKHRESINLYLDLDDWQAAQAEAEKSNQASYLFDQLIDSKQMASFLNSASTASDLTFEQVLEKLPDSAHIGNLQRFFTNFSSSTAKQLRRSGLDAALSRVALTDYSVQLMHLKKRRYDVQLNTACPICHKRLGQAVIGVVNGSMAHYACIELSES